MTDIKITPQIIAAIASSPRLGAQAVADAFDTVCAEYEINTPARAADFLAQCAHESAGFSRLEENLNFTAEQLAGLWSRFSATGERGGAPNADALRLAHDRAAISHEVYGGFHGRGFIQLSTERNYIAFRDKVGIDVVAKPELLFDLDVAATASAWFWRYAGTDLNTFADMNDAPTTWRGRTMPAFEAETRCINTAAVGLATRREFRLRARRVLEA